ncbi:MAG: family transporter, partial [Candidatus Hydrogenedentes bacterium]|nr:family transporter [Candidatus Hydrogenedentota bacterium]
PRPWARTAFKWRNLLSTVLSAIIPVFLVAGAGYGLRRFLALDTKTLSSLNIYLFIPCLVFSSISGRAIEWGVFGRYALAAIMLVAVMWGVLSALARRRGIEGDAYGAFLMTMFPNVGNFGLPVCMFAFGEAGLALAVVVMVCGSFLQNSLGVYFAQRNQHGMGKAFVRVFQYPMIYAFVLALVFQRTGWHLPDLAGRAIDITADAAIPVQLVILGIQLAETKLETSANVFLASVTRLCGGPILACAMAWIVGLSGLDAKVFILQMSGPVAVGMAVYGGQFGVAPRFLASTESWTFLCSIVTVASVLYFLM